MKDGPDFLCVGAQKAGTGWLYEQLRNHADFWMPPVKELHYFDRPRAPRPRPSLRELLFSPKQMRKWRLAHRRRRDLRRNARDPRDRVFLETMEPLYERPETDFDGYARLFAPKDPLLSGDITPAYCTLHEEIIERIAARFPELRVIFIARDPVERVWSQLSMRVRHKTIAPFDPNNVDAVRAQLLRTEVLLRSYPTHITGRWRRHIAAERFRVFFFDDLTADAAKLRAGIISFLGGDPEKPSGAIAPGQNSKAGKPKLSWSADVAAMLAGFFVEELRACAAELGGAAAQWPGKYGI